MNTTAFVSAIFVCLVALIASSEAGPASSNPCDVVRCAYGATCEPNESGEAKCGCHFLCPEVFDQVCGSDGKTYSNACFLRLASCDLQKKITEVHKGPCSSNLCPVRGYIGS